MKRSWKDIKYDNAKYWDEISTVSKELSYQGTLKADRVAVIKLIRLYYSMAQELTPEDLMGSGGAVISAHLCILLGMQYADATQGALSEWQITEKDEPLIFELLTISSSLDIDNNQPKQWERLFEIVHNL